LEGERDSARRRAARADDLAETVAELERRVAELDRAGADHAAIEASLRAALDDTGRIAVTAADAASGVAAEAAGALTDATAAAGRLSEALTRAGRALGLSLLAEGEAVALTDPALPLPPMPAAKRPPVRQPVALPPAVFDDSAEAAEFLVRVRGVTVLVDGYNASLAAWSGLPIAAQRARLIDAAVELAARTGADIHLVFDGADQVAPLGPPSRRLAVRWSFSPPGVEADDVLLQMVDDFDLARPVVVASSDRRVRDGVRARGANAISTPQLFAVLRREL
jgi:predicted RNA-binding protein with PIN domain